MKGERLESGDIRSYLAGGSFVNFEGINKNAFTDKLNAYLHALTVKAVWRAQTVFIVGGGACSDNQGIGSGPKEASLCREGRAWYLYYGKIRNTLDPVPHAFKLASDHRGNVEAPPGLDDLGNASSITVADIISSSLDAYDAANYDYTPETRASRALSVIEDGWRDPSAQGPTWEGIFTIPVCDVSSAVLKDADHKESTLVPYRQESAPSWCPVGNTDPTQDMDFCSGSKDQTRAFLKAAHLGERGDFLVECILP